VAAGREKLLDAGGACPKGLGRGFARRLMRTSVILTLGLLLALPAFAHVTVAPARSTISATETYSVRVPSEGGRTTTGLVLVVPPGVTIVSVGVPKEGGSVAYQRKTEGQTDEVVWTIEIKPGAAVQLVFTATNPPEDGPLVWKFTQKYADGTKGDWVPRVTLGPLEPEPAPAAAPPRAGAAK
jgi:uncharacterized protein YcnI